jgi:hypothetical protein
MDGITVDVPFNATFKLLSPQQDPSAVYDGQILVRGFSHLVIYGDGAIIDANRTGGFFNLHQELGASLTLFNLTMRHSDSWSWTECDYAAITVRWARLLALHSCTVEGPSSMPEKGWTPGIVANRIDTVLITDSTFVKVGEILIANFMKATIRDSTFLRQRGGVRLLNGIMLEFTGNTVIAGNHGGTNVFGSSGTMQLSGYGATYDINNQSYSRWKRLARGSSTNRVYVSEASRNGVVIKNAWVSVAAEEPGAYFIMHSCAFINNTVSPNHPSSSASRVFFFRFSTTLG